MTKQTWEPLSEEALREFTSHRYAAHMRAMAQELLATRAMLVALREALKAAEDIMSRHTSDLDFRHGTGFAPEVAQARAALEQP